MTSLSINKVANNVRLLSAAMVERAKSGHPGGAMGGADFITVLFSEFLIYDPDNPYWEYRDRFYLDPGHMSPMLYSILYLAGKYTVDDIKSFRQWGSITPGHPELDIERGIENASGPLGLGHAFAAGSAIAANFLRSRLGDLFNHKIYAFISDGGIQEEISQGVGRIAGHLGLSNLIMFYDSNNIQLSTTISEVTSENVEEKYKAWNWNVIVIDGNNVDEIRESLKLANDETQRPTLIIGNTIMGLGALKSDLSSHENQVSTHGQPLSASGASFEKTAENLGGNHEAPLEVYPESAGLFKRRKDELRIIVKNKKDAIERWEKENPLLAQKRDKWFSKDLPDIDWSSIQHKSNCATRNASSKVLETLAQRVENMIVSSADLSNSDKTDGFLKHTKAFSKNDFSGAFLQAGVSELTMAALSIGMSLHGGIIAACATFLVFSDYMKPAIRVAALMETPVIFIWTHDSFRVGEDGPTHQPVEHEAQLRLMEKLKNHSGNNSMLILRPADSYETTVSWKMALENKSSPTGLILSRQDIIDIPNQDYSSALSAKNGAYIVQDSSEYDIVLLASGSEVSTLVQSAKLLLAEGIKSRIISIPSEGLFRNQSQEYQNELLVSTKPKFGLTAGLPVTLEKLVGSDGIVWGFNSFGFSAPYKVLDEKLGFTAENIYRQILNKLKSNQEKFVVNNLIKLSCNN